MEAWSHRKTGRLQPSLKVPPTTIHAVYLFSLFGIVLRRCKPDDLRLLNDGPLDARQNPCTRLVTLRAFSAVRPTLFLTSMKGG